MVAWYSMVSRIDESSSLAEVPTANITQNMQVGRFTHLRCTQQQAKSAVKAHGRH